MRKKAIVLFLSFLVHYGHANGEVMLTSNDHNNAEKCFSNDDATNTSKQIVVYWDTSLSMQKNDISKEIYFIDQYLKEHSEFNSIKIITFANDIGISKSFRIEDNLSKELHNVLESLNYGGASNFSLLFKERSLPDQYIVFTDGYSTYGNFSKNIEVPIMFISNSEKTNDVGIDLFLNSNTGFHRNLIHFNDNFSFKQVLEEPYNSNSKQIIDKNLIFGTLTFGNKPLKGCKVRVKGKLVQAESDVKGRFSISAQTGEVLQFTFAGLQTKEMILTGEKELVVDLEQDFKILDKVLLNSKNKKFEDEKVEVNGRLVEQHKSGYAVYNLDNGLFFKSALYFRDIVRQGRIPGLRINWQGEVRIRGASSIKLSNTPLYVIDGVKTFEEPVLFPIDLIKSISVLPSLASTNRYGSFGRNGAVIITTKQGSLFDEEDNDKKFSLLAKGNDYDESLTLIDNNKNTPPYLNELLQSSTFDEAKSKYYSLRNNYSDKIPFYVYSSEYFKKWDVDFANQVVSNIAEVAHMDFSALRTLAFKLEEEGSKEKALVIYQQIFKLRPHSVQSFLDLTRSYEDNGQYQKAFNLYRVILKNYPKSVNFDIVYDQIESQLKRFLNLYRSHIDYSDLPSHLLTYKGLSVRIVFEWNDPQAEFELQFVNPDNKYYKWTRRMTENQEIKEDLKNGVCSKEFIIQAQEQGDWIINVQSFGKDTSFNPDFLKYAVYKNYGLANETKEIHFVKLYNQKDKVTLDKLSL